MIKSELVQELAKENPHLYRREVESVVDTIIEEIARALIAGERVELRGFGVFYSKVREAHQGRNPRTGEPVSILARRVPLFKMGRGMLKRLNRGRDQE